MNQIKDKLDSLQMELVEQKALARKKRWELRDLEGKVTGIYRAIKELESLTQGDS